MFQSWSLKAKLIVSFLAVAAILLVMGGVNLYYLDQVATKFDHIAEINLPNNTTLGVMRGSAKGLFQIMTELALPTTKEDLQRLEQEHKKVVDTYNKFDKVYGDIPFVDGEQELYDKVAAAWKDLQKADEDLWKVEKETESESNNAKYMAAFKGSFEPKLNALVGHLNVLIDFQNAESKKWGDLADQQVSRSKFAGISLVVGGFLLALLLGVILSSRIYASLQGIIVRVDAGSKEVSSASVAIASSSTELSAGATEQAAAIQETAASIDEVTAMVKKNTENAVRSQKASVSSKEAAEDGKNSVENMMAAIRAISESNSQIMKQTEESNSQFAEIVKVINEIAAKTNVINDIVFQTKLLSFNASVEAARAGEHGKGFAVVAEEVGNLATMSGNAAREISELLNGSISRVERIVKESKEKIEQLMAGGKQKIGEGIEKAQLCGESLDNILKLVSEVDGLVAEIASASHEQSTGISEINKAVNQLDAVTQQNTAVAQQSASAGEQLSRQASELKDMVSALYAVLRGHGKSTDNTFDGNGKASAKVAHLSEFKSKREQNTSPQGAAEFKKASGDAMPSSEDPRFKDV